MNPPPNHPPPEPADAAPGVPGFRTWPGVYWFVVGCFALVVVVLTIVSRVYG